MTDRLTDTSEDVAVEEKFYQTILASVHAQLAGWDAPLRATCWPYICALSQRPFIRLMSVLPYYLADLLPVAGETAQRLGRAHFYTCWYYHVQDDLLDGEVSPAQLLGAHLALLKTSEIYARLGLVDTPFWTEFQRLTQTSAEAYAVEMSNRFAQWTELTPDRLASFSLEFIGNRLASFLLSALAQGCLAGLAPDHPLQLAICATLRNFMVARQIGDDVGDWASDLQAGQLNYVSARLISRMIERGSWRAGHAAGVEQLAAHQLCDEDLWNTLEAVSDALYTQTAWELEAYPDSRLNRRVVEPQKEAHQQMWIANRRHRALLREMLGVRPLTAAVAYDYASA